MNSRRLFTIFRIFFALFTTSHASCVEVQELSQPAAKALKLSFERLDRALSDARKALTVPNRSMREKVRPALNRYITETEGAEQGRAALLRSIGAREDVAERNRVAMENSNENRARFEYDRELQHCRHLRDLARQQYEVIAVPAQRCYDQKRSRILRKSSYQEVVHAVGREFIGIIYRVLDDIRRNETLTPQEKVAIFHAVTERGKAHTLSIKQASDW